MHPVCTLFFRPRLLQQSLLQEHAHVSSALRHRHHVDPVDFSVAKLLLASLTYLGHDISQYLLWKWLEPRLFMHLPAQSENNCTPTLALESIQDGIPIIFGGNHIADVQKCVYTLDSQGHSPGVVLSVDGEPTCNYSCSLTWGIDANLQLKNAHADIFESVERSAIVISLLLIKELTPFTAISQAARGSRVDYYLGDKETGLFGPQCARLEVTGIINDALSEVKRRAKLKEKRLSPDSKLPVYIIVVEHSTPLVYIVVRP